MASTNDHVDLINHSVQHFRLLRGDIDRTLATGIAGGEKAHVGDVIATRRNDRRLVTTTGEPVRNRETWTVTDVHVDGSITASHQGGHGTVVLPGEYVREHVRLGYAATEHGWQSDTVGAAYALASAQTTRRGLYVAATRGTDENVIFVVTESDDVAEARDVLEGVLALDRADTPAVAQRRNLSEQLHSSAARTSVPPQPRCAIPAWFPQFLDDARRNLADATTREAVSEAKHRQLDAEVASGRARVRQGRSRDRAISPRHRRGSRRRHRSPTSQRRHPAPVAHRTASTTPIVAPGRGSRGHSSAARRGASGAG